MVSNYIIANEVSGLGKTGVISKVKEFGTLYTSQYNKGKDMRSLHLGKDLDTVQDITNWFKAAKPKPTTRDVCTQIGCHYEEISEMDVALYEPTDNEQLADWYKGKFINESNVMERMDKLELLDSLCDQIVTAVGIGYMLGFDMQSAIKEVIRSNNSKMVDGKFIFDVNGKIMKPESFSQPDLTKFVGDSNGK